MKIIATARRVITPDMMATRTRRVVVPGPRSSGLHVQAINKYLAQAAGKLASDDTPSPFEAFSDTCYPLLPALGVIWEEFAASTYSNSELLWQPGELLCDNITGSMDGLLPQETAIWECKLTFKKEQPVNECWLYMKQGLAYCHMSGLQRVRYDVCWLCGNYMRPYQPVWTSSLVEFTEQEIALWWKNVLAAAKSGKVKEE